MVVPAAYVCPTMPVRHLFSNRGIVSWNAHWIWTQPDGYGKAVGYSQNMTNNPYAFREYACNAFMSIETVSISLFMKEIVEWGDPNDWS